MVRHFARRYGGRGLTFDELCSEGFVGLLEASRRFDRSRGVAFTTYSTWWIRKRIVDALLQQTQVVRVTSHRLRKAPWVEREQHRRSVRERGGSNLDLLAAAAGIHAGVARTSDPARVRIVSLDEPAAGAGTPRLERVPDPSEGPLTRVLREESRHLVHRIIDELADRERRILIWRFGLGGEESASLREIGERLGLSRERVRQLLERTLDGVRSRLLEDDAVITD